MELSTHTTADEVETTFEIHGSERRGRWNLPAAPLTHLHTWPWYVQERVADYSRLPALTGTNCKCSVATDGSVSSTDR